ncbi:MAG: nuclear transport factor 2 family protein [Acidobacteriota bacterium]
MSEVIRHIIRETNDAFSRNEGESFLDFCSDDMSWKIAGGTTLNGKEEIRTFLNENKCPGPPIVQNCSIIVEGTSAACHGDMTMDTGDGKDKKYSFCDVYEFTGDKISKLTSYVVPA